MDFDGTFHWSTKSRIPGRSHQADLPLLNFMYVGHLLVFFSGHEKKVDLYVTTKIGNYIVFIGSTSFFEGMVLPSQYSHKTTNIETMLRKN